MVSGLKVPLVRLILLLDHAHSLKPLQLQGEEPATVNVKLRAACRKVSQLRSGTRSGQEAETAGAGPLEIESLDMSMLSVDCISTDG